MRSPPRKPTASGSSKSSFHSKTPDGAGTSPAPPFSFPAPQQKAGIPGEAKEDILSVPAGGSSHYRDVGRILFWKRTRPTPRKKSTRAFRLRPGPPTTQRARAAALSLWKPSPGDGGRRWAPAFGNPSRSWTGERQQKEGQGASCLEHWCAADFLVRGHSSGRNRYSATGRRLLDLVGSL